MPVPVSVPYCGDGTDAISHPKHPQLQKLSTRRHPDVDGMGIGRGSPPEVGGVATDHACHVFEPHKRMRSK